LYNVCAGHMVICPLMLFTAHAIKGVKL
jgi:hypothetical protein